MRSASEKPRPRLIAWERQYSATASAIPGGRIGAEHLDGYLALPDPFQVTSICDIDSGFANRLAARAPGTRRTGDLASVLADPAIDIVDIYLLPALHDSVALDAVADRLDGIDCALPSPGAGVRSIELASATYEAARTGRRGTSSIDRDPPVCRNLAPNPPP